MDYEMRTAEHGILYVSDDMRLEGYVDEPTLLLLSKADVMLKALRETRQALEQNCDCAYIYNIIEKAVREATSFVVNKEE